MYETFVFKILICKVTHNFNYKINVELTVQYFSFRDVEKWSPVIGNARNLIFSLLFLCSSVTDQRNKTCQPCHKCHTVPSADKKCVSYQAKLDILETQYVSQEQTRVDELVWASSSLCELILCFMVHVNRSTTNQSAWSQVTQNEYNRTCNDLCTVSILTMKTDQN